MPSAERTRFLAIGAGASVLARVTRDAVESLGLHLGSDVWVLVKAVSMRSHAR